MLVAGLLRNHGRLDTQGKQGWLTCNAVCVWNTSSHKNSEISRLDFWIAFWQRRRKNVQSNKWNSLAKILWIYWSHNSGPSRSEVIDFDFDLDRDGVKIKIDQSHRFRWNVVENVFHAKTSLYLRKMKIVFFAKFLSDDDEKYSTDCSILIPSHFCHIFDQQQIRSTTKRRV